jgi:hypothetical protein
MTRSSTLRLLASFVLGSTIFTASSGATFAGGLDGLGKGLSGLSVNVSGRLVAAVRAELKLPSQAARKAPELTATQL